MTREQRPEYELLKRAGHCAAKAIEILIDAERGDKHALAWIEAVKKLEPRP